ncbi:hypothetical protein IFM89_018455 [Coptis chinensis]|uniref:Uncharacterized protein n=1 Tax=Coptis chinensis TaxID=261450 RepID=A0A835H603_9MAGN|nr:hypothetical protein IFM89_018455 [Coptis chinensis]
MEKKKPASVQSSSTARVPVIRNVHDHGKKPMRAPIDQKHIGPRKPEGQRASITTNDPSLLGPGQNHNAKSNSTSRRGVSEESRAKVLNSTSHLQGPKPQSSQPFATLASNNFVVGLYSSSSDPVHVPSNSRSSGSLEWCRMSHKLQRVANRGCSIRVGRDTEKEGKSVYSLLLSSTNGNTLLIPNLLEHSDIIDKNTIKFSMVLDDLCDPRPGDFGLAKLCDHGGDPQTSRHGSMAIDILDDLYLSSVLTSNRPKGKLYESKGVEEGFLPCKMNHKCLGFGCHAFDYAPRLATRRAFGDFCLKDSEG